MCGLTGGWTRRRFDLLKAALPGMTNALVHRGPDDKGEWFDGEAGIALGHRRLSIVDVTNAGHQPMVSSSGRWVIAFNGEIYNHWDLRAELDSAAQAPFWRGSSDTETLLACISAWGVERALKRVEGMFAFALWDRLERDLWLARDRLGEKPLYYGWNRGVFLFGSELKAIKAFTGFDAPIDREAVALYLRHNAIPAPLSIYSGISKLLPGHFLHLTTEDLARNARLPPVPYWSASAAARAGYRNPYQGSLDDAVDELQELLLSAVRRQMVADVPLGAFLSGGVDSSLVVSLMQSQSARPVRTFSIGFDVPGYNEADYARAVALHLGTDHTELIVSSKQALNVIPLLSSIYDEPFADSSQIPTFLVSQLAREHVTVALSGDGGDELFGGYSRYFLAANYWKKVAAVPRPIRKLASLAISSVSTTTWDKTYRAIETLIPESQRWSLPGDKLHKAAGVLGEESGRMLYRGLISHWEPSELMPEVNEPAAFGVPRVALPSGLTEYMMLEDSCHYLPDDILVKVDRAAMAVSLETRVPLLDHHVFEFAWRLPLAYKVRGGMGKHILREVLYRDVPRKLIDRPKMGFGIPLDSWLRGPLKDWAASLLDSSRLKHEGFFNPRAVELKWAEHQSGARNWQYHLWDILMFQSWLHEQGRG